MRVTNIVLAIAGMFMLLQTLPRPESNQTNQLDNKPILSVYSGVIKDGLVDIKVVVNEVWQEKEKRYHRIAQLYPIEEEGAPVGTISCYDLDGDGEIEVFSMVIDGPTTENPQKSLYHGSLKTKAGWKSDTELEKEMVAEIDKFGTQIKQICTKEHLVLQYAWNEDRTKLVKLVDKSTMPLK